MHTLEEDQDTVHKTDQSNIKATIFSRIRLVLKRSGHDLPGGEMLDAKTEEHADYHVQSYTNCRHLIKRKK